MTVLEITNFYVRINFRSKILCMYEIKTDCYRLKKTSLLKVIIVFEKYSQQIK